MAIGRSIKRQDCDMGPHARRYASRRLRRYAQKRRYAEQALIQGPGKSRWATAHSKRKRKAIIHPEDPVVTELLAGVRAYMAAFRKPLGGG